MVKIKKQLIKDTPFKFGRSNGKKYITIHETANTSKGANAQVHANLQSNGNSRDAAWHYQVDDKQAIQSFVHDLQLWNAGDGEGDGNLNGISVEICVNSDAKQTKAYKNAAKLVKKIMKHEGIASSNVVQHNHWSGKDCPHFLRAGKWYSWHDFKKLIDGAKVKKPKKTKTKSKQTSKNLGLVDYMASKDMDNSMSARKTLAKQYKIKGYKGTAKQNTKLLKLIKKGKPTKKKKKKSIATMAKEIIDGKHGSGHENRRKSLGISKAKYKKVRAKVNALAGGSKPKKKKSKSIAQMAEEVKAGKHGNGNETRRKSLGISKAKYEKVRAKVNGKSSGGGKSVKQMADEIINGKGIPQGHEARRKHFGISKAKYEKVRKEVNRRM